MNTMLCPLEHDPKVQRPTLKRTMSSSWTVSNGRYIFRSSLTHEPFLASLDELITHGLHALRETLQQDKELTIMNTSIGIVGPPASSETRVKAGGAFRILEGEPIAGFLTTMTPKEVVAAAPEPDTDDDEPPAAPGGGDVQMSDA
jgi:20S proteasome subunit alpha 6